MLHILLHTSNLSMKNTPPPPSYMWHALSFSTDMQAISIPHRVESFPHIKKMSYSQVIKGTPPKFLWSYHSDTNKESGLPFYHSTDLPVYLSTVLHFYWSTVLRFYRSNGLPFYCSTGLPFYESTIQPLYRSTALPVYHSTVWWPEAETSSIRLTWSALDINNMNYINKIKLEPDLFFRNAANSLFSKTKQ